MRWPVIMKSLARVMPDQAQRPLGAAAARDHAEPDLGERELRAERRDAEVAGHRQLEAGAHREAVDGGDDGLPAALGRGERVAPQLEVGGREREELRDVAARAEGLAACASITMTRTPSSASSPPKMPGNSLRMATVIVFILGCRSIQRVATAPFRSTRRNSLID